MSTERRATFLCARADHPILARLNRIPASFVLIVCALSVLIAFPGLAPAQTLTIAKAANGSGGGGAFVAGVTESYTLTVTNTHASTATDGTTITVTDSFTGEANLTPGMATGSGWSCSTVSKVVTCTTTAVIASSGGTAPAITVPVIVSAGATGTVSNSASVVGGGDATSAGSGTIMTTVAAITDLSITKIDSPDPVIAGSTLTYTVTVTNNGPSNSTGAVVTDTLPADVTAVSTSPIPPFAGCSEGTGAASASMCTMGAIPAGASRSYTISVVVDSSASGTITNSITVVGNQAEPTVDPNANTVMQTTTVNQQANLSITKTDSPDPVLAGESLTYIISVTNFGPSDATGVTVTDTLPSGVSSPTTSGCSQDPSGGATCTLGAIAAGTSKMYTLTVTVDNSTTGSITNMVSVTGTQTDPVSANNSASATTTVSPNADIRVSKTDSADPVLPNGTLTYTITVTNDGPQTANNIVVTDTLPAGVTFSASMADTTCDNEGGTLGGTAATPTCTFASLSSGNSEVFTYTVTVNSGASGIITNNVSVDANEGDPNPGNNFGSEGTLVQGAATPVDVSISKSGAPDPVLPGGALTYTITVTNNSAVNTATNVIVTDTLPGSVTFVSNNGNTTCDNEGGTLGGTAAIPTCTFASLGPTMSETFTFSVTVSGGASGTLINNASVTADQSDPSPGNNFASAATQVNVPTAAVDLSISKASLPNPVAPSGTLIYTITVKNNSMTEAATNVVVTDTLPAAVTFSGTTADTTCDNVGGTPGGTALVPTCTFATLAADAMQMFSYTVTVGSGATGIITNNVSVDGDESDPNPGNNFSSEGTLVQAAVVQVDMSIAKSGSPDPVSPGGNLTYTITVTNNSATNAATNVVVTDTLPSSVTFVSNNGNTTCDNEGGTLGGSAAVPTCSFTSIAATMSETFTYSVTVNGGATGTLINNVSVTAGQSDPAPGNNFASAATQVNVPTTSVDMSITKASSPDPVVPNGTLTYTITVRNNSMTDAATNVVVTDTLPGAVTFTTTAGSNTTCDNTGGTLSGTLAAPVCTYPSIAANSMQVFTYTVTVNNNASGTLINNVNVSANENDPSPGNNFTTASTQVNVPTALADLSISKTPSATPLSPLDPLTYTITVTNNGPNPATNVIVTDTLPPNVTFVSTTGCVVENQISSGVVTCAVNLANQPTPGQLASGATDSFALAVTIGAAASGTLINAVSVDGTENDPNPGNNFASTPVQVNVTTLEADLSITKSGPASPVNPGDMFIYQIVVTNNNAMGGAPATNVLVSDNLPAGVDFEAAVLGNCTAPGAPGDLGTVECVPAGSIAPQGTATFQFSVTLNPDGAGPLLNAASVSGAELDPNPVNNFVTEATQVIPNLPVQVSSLQPSTRQAGDSSFDLIIQGQNFPQDAVVRWVQNGTDVQLSRVVASAQILANVPAALIDLLTPTNIDVQIIIGGPTTSCNTSAPANCAILTVTPSQPPVINGVSPAIVENVETRTITIGGDNFIPGAQVYIWDGAQASPNEGNAIAAPLTPSVTTVNTITVSVPGDPYFRLADAAQSETRLIGVKNPRNSGRLSQMQRVIEVVSILPPNIFAINPPSACTDSGETTIRLDGQNFRAGAQVEFGTGNVLAPSQVGISNNEIEIVIPAGELALDAPATRSIRVTNPDGRISDPADFMIRGPVLNIGNPLVPGSVIQRTAEFQLRVNGDCFALGATARWNQQPLVTTRNSVNQLTATVGADRILDPATIDVTVINPSGAASGVAPFTVIGDGVPPVISNFRVVSGSVTATSATVAFDTDEPAKGKAFFGPDPSQFMETPLGTTFLTSHIVEIFGLTPGALYFVQAAALDAGELEGRSQTLTFTTLDNQGPTFTSPLDILGITETSAILVFTTSEPASSTVFYGTNPSGLQSLNTPGRFTDHFVPLAGLTPGSTYFVRVEIEDAAGNNTTGPFRTFNTLDKTGPGITNARHQILSQSTVNVLWNTSEPATTQVEFGLTTELGQMTAIDPSLVTSHSVLLTGLDPQKVYYYRARSEDALGNNSFSSIGTFIIQLDPIPAITFSTVDAMTDPARQPTLQLLLAEPYPLDINGTLTLDFTDNAVNPGDDQTITFSRNGLREILFTIPARRTRAEFEGEGSRTTVRYQTGTVAGTINLEIPNLDVLNNDLTPNPIPSASTTIQLLPPVIRTMTVDNVSDAGFNAVIVGYSTPREMEALRFRFTARDPNTIINVENDTFQVTDLFDAWYQDPASEEVGSQFTLTIPFQIGGGVGLLEGIFVTAINSEGESPEVGAAIPLPPPPQ